MARIRRFRATAFLCALVVLLSAPLFGQFTANIQGVVQDQSGAGMAKASIQLINVGTGVKKETNTDASGNYRFVSIAPGDYKITVEASGFAKTEVSVTVLTEQNLNIPISLKVGSTSESVIVTSEAPIVDTADSRTQLTLDNESVAQLPIIGRNLVTLVTMAPGASGLGTSTSGSPASGVDNYSTEEQVDASANGQGQNNNQYVVDGLDVTSGIRQGVLNLTPQPDSIQETSVQVNTFSVEHSRAAGLQTIYHAIWHGSVPRIGSGLVQLPGDVREPAFRGLSVPAIPLQQHGFCDRWSDRSAPHSFSISPWNRCGLRPAPADRLPLRLLSSSISEHQLSRHTGTHVMATYLPSGVSGITVQQTASAGIRLRLRHRRGTERSALRFAHD